MTVRFKPLDIRNQEFSKKFQGYRPEDVRNFLAQVAEFVDDILQENRTLRNEIDSLHKRISSLERQATTIKEAMEEQAKRTIEEARNKANEILGDAENQAQSVLREMQLDVDTKREELYDLVGMYTSYKAEMLRILEGLINSINEFENSRQSRNAKKAIGKMSVRFKPIKPLDAMFVVKHTVHRRMRKYFENQPEQDEEMQ